VRFHVAPLSVDLRNPLDSSPPRRRCRSRPDGTSRSAQERRWGGMDGVRSVGNAVSGLAVERLGAECHVPRVERVCIPGPV